MKKTVYFLLMAVVQLFFYRTNCQIVSTLDVNQAIAEETVDITHSDFDINSIHEVFDNNFNNLARSAAINPLIITLQFDNPINFKAGKLKVSESTCTWSLEAANVLSDLDSKTNTYTSIFLNRTLTDGIIDSADFSATNRKIIRLTVNDDFGDDFIHLNEWQIFVLANVDSMNFKSTSEYDTLLINLSEQLQVLATDTVMKISILLSNSLCTWNTSDNITAEVTPDGKVFGKKIGECQITATYYTKQAILNLHVIEDKNAPDLTVCYIKRLPEIDYVENSPHPESEGWPSVGQSILWRAYVKNYSPDTLKNVSYNWMLNNAVISTSIISEILPYSLAHADLNYQWDFNRNLLTFKIDNNNSIDEVNEVNNELLIYTDAISINLYVEQPVYDHYRKYQSLLNVGTNCWEDWAQILHVKRWNKMFAEAVYPETPNGVLDRIRIDSIVLVPKASLPLHGGAPSNNPNIEDKTVDLQWGFAEYLLNGDFYKDYYKASDNNAFYFEGSLFHELGHARYLIDTYGFDVSQGDSTVNIKEGTDLIAGTYYMPYIAWDAMHYNDMQGLMSGGYTMVEPYSAICMNLIDGHRAVCGNMNSPCNIGVFMNDLPNQNILTLKDQYGNLLSDASVQIYQVVSSGYGKYYDNTPDMLLTANANGQVSVGKCPFTASGEINGPGDGVLIIRAELNGKIGYAFLESTHFNIEYWRGNTSAANYEVDINMFGEPLDLSIQQPYYGELFNARDTISIECTSTSPDIKNIEFFMDNVSLGTDTESPYNFSFVPSNPESNSHIIRALLTDNNDNAVFRELSIYTRNNSEFLPEKAAIPDGQESLCQNPENQTYFTEGATGAISYTWDISPTNAGTIISQGTSAIVNFNNTFTGNAEITVQGENEIGLGEVSDTLDVEVSICTSIKNSLSDKSVNVYPIPSKGIVNIEFENTSDEDITIEVINLSGQVVFNKITRNKAEQIDLGGMIGLFFIRITSNKLNYLNKLIVN